MTSRKIARLVKGAVVSTVAASASYWIWTSGREWAGGVREANPDAFFSGALESVLATAAGVMSMPLLLWAGMRALRERGNHLLVTLGTVAWLLLGGHVVEDDVSVWGTVAYLASFAITGGLLALPNAPDKS